MSSIKVHVITCDDPPSLAPDFNGQHWVSGGQQWLSVGTSTVDDWVLVDTGTLISGIITASSAADLDITALDDLCTTKYIVCINNVTEDKWRSFEMLAGKKTATTLEDTLYSQIGSTLDVDFNFNVDGTDAKLVGTNNETFDIDYRIKKILV